MKRGVATFLVLIPFIVLVLLLTVTFYSVEKTRLDSQGLVLKSFRQKQIDSSIKQSLKEILEFYSTSPVYREWPCEDESDVKGKLTLTAGKISGLYVTAPDTWAGFLTAYYASQGVAVEFFANPTGFNALPVPLTAEFSIPELGITVGPARLILTCNSVTGVITNHYSSQLVHFGQKINSLSYTVTDSKTGLTWTKTIPTDLYRPEATK